MVCVALLVLGGCTSSSPATHRVTGSVVSPPATPPTLTHSAPISAPPRLRHLVVVLEENRSYRDIVGRPQAPYLNSLVLQGASLTDYVAVAHPSEPNYLALFAGSTRGLGDDSCPHTFTGANLAGELLAARRTFVGYSEGLPAAGDETCLNGSYARKHNPWSDFPALPANVNQPMSAFPTDYDRLPDVAFVVPDMHDDMHDGSVQQADTWLRTTLSGYVRWASTHDSALVVTWDEDDHSEGNQVPAIIVGDHVHPQLVATRADHYTLLRTVEWLFGLPAAGASAQRVPLTSIWATR